MSGIKLFVVNLHALVLQKLIEQQGNRYVDTYGINATSELIASNVDQGGFRFIAKWLSAGHYIGVLTTYGEGNSQAYERVIEGYLRAGLPERLHDKIPGIMCLSHAGASDRVGVIQRVLGTLSKQRHAVSEIYIVDSVQHHPTLKGGSFVQKHCCKIYGNIAEADAAVIAEEKANAFDGIYEVNPPKQSHPFLYDVLHEPVTRSGSLTSQQSNASGSSGGSSTSQETTVIGLLEEDPEDPYVMHQSAVTQESAVQAPTLPNRNLSGGNGNEYIMPGKPVDFGSSKEGEDGKNSDTASEHDYEELNQTNEYMNLPAGVPWLGIVTDTSEGATRSLGQAGRIFLADVKGIPGLFEIRYKPIPTRVRSFYIGLDLDGEWRHVDADGQIALSDILAPSIPYQDEMIQHRLVAFLLGLDGVADAIRQPERPDLTGIAPWQPCQEGKRLTLSVRRVGAGQNESIVPVPKASDFTVQHISRRGLLYSTESGYANYLPGEVPLTFEDSVDRFHDGLSREKASRVIAWLAKVVSRSGTLSGQKMRRSALSRQKNSSLVFAEGMASSALTAHPARLLAALSAECDIDEDDFMAQARKIAQKVGQANAFEEQDFEQPEEDAVEAVQ